jgi:hypothetical protein
MRTSFRPLAFVIAVACVMAGPWARASDTTNPDGSIKVTNAGGDFSRFTVLTSGDLNDNNNTMSGSSLIMGNVGIGGHGNFSMSGGEFDGDLYMNSYGNFTLSGPAKHNGNTFYNQDTVLNNALGGAQYLAGQAAIDTNTGSYTVTQGSFNGTTENGNQNVTLMGSGHIVLKLTDFVMTGGTFTLQGSTTVPTSYIIDVSRNFSLSGNAKIVLSNIPASHVLFNIIGTGNAITIQQGSSMQGILLAYQRKVNLSGGKVFGRVIAEQLALSGGGQVISQ